MWLNKRRYFLGLFVFLSVVCINESIAKQAIPALRGKAGTRVSTSQDGVYEQVLQIFVLNRHGDRAPVGQLPTIDKHAQNPTFFWPNG